MVIADRSRRGPAQPLPQGDTSLRFLILLIAKLCEPEYRQTMATDLTDAVSSTDLTDPVNKISLDSYTKSCPPGWAGTQRSRTDTLYGGTYNYNSYGIVIRTWR